MIEHLPWDSDTFGFRVGRLLAGASDAELLAGLAQARGDRYRLLYLAAPHGRPLPPGFPARLVDRKVTFAKAATSHAPEAIPEYPVGPADARLIALAHAAGEWSRYFVDPDFPRHAAERLYEIWIDRSARREIAGTVFATGGAGMITVDARDGTGNIGLFAVAPESRGRGLGSALMRAGENWMAARGAARFTVVTQQDNADACRLYHRFQYTIESVVDVYHIWL
jgi:dTDP-4-amino-4,6-dideoxy-D-galactose acyltransferase